jgi:hypothetical protein
LTLAAWVLFRNQAAASLDWCECRQALPGDSDGAEDRAGGRNRAPELVYGFLRSHAACKPQHQERRDYRNAAGPNDKYASEQMGLTDQLHRYARDRVDEAEVARPDKRTAKE